MQFLLPGALDAMVTMTLLNLSLLLGQSRKSWKFVFFPFNSFHCPFAATVCLLSGQRHLRCQTFVHAFFCVCVCGFVTLKTFFFNLLCVLVPAFYCCYVSELRNDWE